MSVSDHNKLNKHLHQQELKSLNIVPQNRISQQQSQQSSNQVSLNVSQSNKQRDSLSSYFYRHGVEEESPRLPTLDELESCDIYDQQEQETQQQQSDSTGDGESQIKLINTNINSESISNKDSYLQLIHSQFLLSQRSNSNNKDLIFDSDFTDQDFDRRDSTILPMDHLRIQSSNKNLENQVHYETIGHIPCLYLDFHNSRQVILYFHANGEDIGQTREMLLDLNLALEINVICMEYPNYGIYKSSQCTTDKIISDAEMVYNFLLQTCKFEEKNILVMGRSIGSGSAVHIASKFKPGALLLISALSSIKSVVKDIGGWVSQFLIKERFNNLNLIEKVKSPCLLIHGLKDTLISYNHSQKLYDACKSEKKQIKLSKHMTHNELSFIDDVITPIMRFLHSHKILHTKIQKQKFLFQQQQSQLQSTNNQKKIQNTESQVKNIGIFTNNSATEYFGFQNNRKSITSECKIKIDKKYFIHPISALDSIIQKQK